MHLTQFENVNLLSSGADQWLSEATFLTGKGPGEAIDKITETPEEAGIVKVSCKPMKVPGISIASTAAGGRTVPYSFVSMPQDLSASAEYQPHIAIVHASLMKESLMLQRRLLIGAVLTVAVVGLSLLPTDALRFSRPSKPLFFYLTPLVRVQFLLEDLEKAANEGETDGEL